MRNSRTLAILGVAAAAVVGLAGFAVAQSHAHTLTVRLPDGSLEKIHYYGDVAPRVVVSAQAAPVVLASPVAAPFDWSTPFALMDRISAQMDRDSTALMRQMDAMTMPGVGAAGFGVPGFAQGLSLASGLTGKGVCGRSVQVTSTSGQAPKVVTTTWGDCGSRTAGKPPAAPAGHVVQAKAAVPAHGPKVSI